MIKIIFSFIILVMLCGCYGESSNELYVFTYFVNEKDGMHLAVSKDGLNWKPLNNNKPVLKSEVGDSLLRDPSVIQDANGVFHLVYTTSWTDLGFGYTQSIDLKNWKDQKFIPIDTGILSEGVRNAWAPELFYDFKNKEYYIIWASAKRYIPTLQTGFKGDQKQYFI
ncbi:family 43 glycosylhydrolase [uncultured Draconibacterium sp.]|uniref:family 43 glycosylhydrolase n=1 Tax=uncultured Draconibacterium sp. TaxID=1573823 RepID=UPI0029C8865F|nr:family 43 glycosylhydrolase [uncultured Draconibacterium sp.]